jgi:hypothetical protein
MDSNGKETSAAQSQSATLVENFNKPNGEGGSTIGFTDPVQAHSIDTHTALATFGEGDARFGKMDLHLFGDDAMGEYHLAKLHGYAPDQKESHIDELKDAVDILKGVREAFPEK